jgi:hypothetical protein
MHEKRSHVSVLLSYTYTQYKLRAESLQRRAMAYKLQPFFQRRASLKLIPLFCLKLTTLSNNIHCKLWWTNYHSTMCHCDRLL